jgi:hypothetical protein
MSHQPFHTTPAANQPPKLTPQKQALYLTVDVCNFLGPSKDNE